MTYTLYVNNDLWISTRSSKHRAESGYNYFVTSWACTAHSAFTTMSELKRWLRNRGLSMPSKVKSKNNPNYRKLIGNYDRCYTWDLAEFEQIRKEYGGYYFVDLDNGDKTLFLAFKQDGKNKIMCANPNVHTRMVFHYRTTPLGIKVKGYAK